MSLREFISKVACVAVTAAAVMVMALSMASHTPYRVEIPRTGQTERRTGKWHTVYVLGAGCSCSTKVADHLARRGRLVGIDETVVLVGREALLGNRLASVGFPILRQTPVEASALYGVKSAPVLLLIDPAGEIKYSGGFSRSTDFRDGFQERGIWDAVRSGHAPPSLPAYGCALRNDDAAFRLSRLL